MSISARLESHGLAQRSANYPLMGRKHAVCYVPGTSPDLLLDAVRNTEEKHGIRLREFCIKEEAHLGQTVYTLVVC